MTLDEVRETALINFETLLNFWGIEYKKITEHEYDILATWRTDKNFGSVRFNTDKGRGADFAGGFLEECDYIKFGAGFDKSDFNGFSGQGQSKIGFDIIGLCQRILNLDTYKKTKEQVENILTEISKTRGLIPAASDAAERRKKEAKSREKRLITYARDLWESSKFHKFKGSIGEKYLKSRGITKQDKNMRFNPSIQYGTLRQNFPALLFKVQQDPEGPLVAIHRIYLDNSGTKAKLDNPKMALAPVKGAGIWFGELSSTLALTEGPENALTLRELGYSFVVSSIFGSNLHNIKIPKYIKKLIIFPDTDSPGLAAFERAKQVYGALNIEVEGYLLPRGDLDLNDLLVQSNQ